MALTVHVAENPALQGVLLRLRSRETPRHRFRELLELAGLLLAYEAAPRLPLRRRRVVTPLSAEAEGVEPAGDQVAVVAVLRAAVPMAMGVLRLIEDADLGFVAATRLEDEPRLPDGGFAVETPYWKTPRIRDRHLVLVDPMLATGSTLAKIAERLLAEKPQAVTILNLIAARPGIERLRETLQGVDAALYTAAVDPVLDERGYIVPGLGDAGDRCFGEA